MQQSDGELEEPGTEDEGGDEGGCEGGGVGAEEPDTHTIPARLMLLVDRVLAAASPHDVS